MGIWKKGFPLKDPAGRVLSRCGSVEVHCEESPDARLKLAVFLQFHDEDPSAGKAEVRIAYRSYHPKPIRFTRRIECTGGEVGEHDAADVLALAVGRANGRPYLEAIVPDAVEVVPTVTGAQVKAEIVAVEGDSFLSGSEFTVLFPSSGTPTCPCC